jgi:hypothetical protein
MLPLVGSGIINSHTDQRLDLDQFGCAQAIEAN